MARSSHAVSSLLHPVYGSAARDIRAAVGVSPAARTAKLARQIDGLQRAMVLRDRDFRGIVITQNGDAAGTRITPDHRRFVAIDCPDGSILWEQGNDGHELVGCVNVAAIIDEITALLEADTDFMNAVCVFCGATPS